jgi:FKBP-type peptidyl-prolyl cis-trans isomerase SlyD
VTEERLSQVEAGKVVSFHYTLTNGSGEVLDSSADREPLPYLHGAGNIVPGLEQQLSGKAVGDKFDAVVAPADGYGERSGPEPQAVERGAFPPDAPLQKGMQFMAQTPDGQHIPLWIDRIEGDTVYVDHNHPLAGVTLHFAVEITGIRDATAEEQAHGHPHGPGGHHH